MKLNGKEHSDIMAQFEREFSDSRLDREPKPMWKKGIIYQDGETNRAFIAYRKGYALAKCIYQ